MILEASTFLFVPVPPSSTINSSPSVSAAPISVPPSMSRDARGTDPPDNPEPDPVTVVVYDKLPEPSLTKIPFATSVAGRVYVTFCASELGDFNSI